MTQPKPVFPLHPAVTLDGHSGSGKSTLAKRLALALGWAYLDSGAWYRALTWAVLEDEGDPSQVEEVLQTLSNITISCQPNGAVLLDGVPLTDALRTPRIDVAVSDVADHPQVRQLLTERMRALRLLPDILGVVADGRDAGSMIFPDAQLKVFVEVPLEIRAQRRFEQQRQNNSGITLSQVSAALLERDQRDAGRGDAAPRILPDSRVLHNYPQTQEEAIGCLLKWIQDLS